MEYVEAALAPYGRSKQGGWWYYWMFSGRFKGAHVPGYDIRRDPENQRVCPTCDVISFMPPEEWKPHDKDIIHVSEVRDYFEAYTLVVKDKVFHSIDFDPCPPGSSHFGSFVKRQLSDLGITDGYLVTIDYCNEQERA
jgi:hypothetical protein